MAVALEVMNGTIEGDSLLTSGNTLSDDNMQLMRQKLCNELKQFEYITALQRIEDLPFYGEIEQYQQANIRSRDSCNNLVCSWSMNILFWLMIASAGFSIYNGVPWFLPFVLVLVAAIVCGVSCSIGFADVCSTVDAKATFSSFYTVYVWKRAVSSLLNSDRMSVGQQFAWRAPPLPHYEISWTAPDGTKDKSVKYMRSPSQKRLEAHDISTTLNQTSIDRFMDDVEIDGGIANVCLFKTYAFQDEAMRNEYIKQGMEFIVETLKDLHDCTDIKLNPLGLNEAYWKQQSYVIQNNAAKRTQICYWFCHWTGFWCVFDTMVYCKMQKQRKAFVVVKEIQIKDKERKI